jgi:hypothetical protein
MTESITNGLAYARSNQHRFVAELGRFVGFPSVSAQRWHAGDVRNCAAWLVDHLREMGLQEVKIVRTDCLSELEVRPRKCDGAHLGLLRRAASRTGRGMAFAAVRAGRARRLPLWAWRFRRQGPNVRARKGDRVVPESSGPHSGQHHMSLRGRGGIGSPNLPSFLIAHSRTLTADCAVVSDMQIPATDRPAITYALRAHSVSKRKCEVHNGICIQAYLVRLFTTLCRCCAK